jgi:hypothetical protein
MASQTIAPNSQRFAALALGCAFLSLVSSIFAIQWVIALFNGSFPISIGSTWFHPTWIPIGAFVFAIWSLVCGLCLWTRRRIAFPLFVSFWPTALATMAIFNLLFGTRKPWIVALYFLGLALFGFKISIYLRRTLWRAL